MPKTKTMVMVALIAALMVSGCAGGVGRATMAEQAAAPPQPATCTGAWWSLGDASGCGVKSNPISVPGSRTVSGVVCSLANGALAFFGRDPMDCGSSQVEPDPAPAPPPPPIVPIGAAV